MDNATGHMSQDGSSISTMAFALFYLSFGVVISILLLSGLLDQLHELKGYEVWRILLSLPFYFPLSGFQ